VSQRVLDSIRRHLGDSGVPFTELEHVRVTTSEEAARIRGCPLAMGAKSIVFKADGVFRLFVTSAALNLRSREIRRHLGVRRTRFATPQELLDLTGLEPGAVPPFGEPILPLQLYVDPALLENETIAFTPGVHTISIFMKSADYLEVARPEVFIFAE
jgi:Ala-tRNA(Pro) deacylase